MRFVTRDVYLSEFESMNFTQRLYFSGSNHELELPHVTCNPLKWSIMTIIYALIYILKILVLVVCLIPALIFEAVMLKNRYKDMIDKESSFMTNCKVLEI